MQLLTVREAAVRLGCSQALVYELCSKRRITHVRLGTGRGTIRIKEEALEELLAACEVKIHEVSKKLRHIRAG